ncbi:hypothetical protein RJT34_01496 [Clitoria ternatea]|uniref:Uncharacterized protein n=1 Tax=Clitoria ternatea TaxID=43366 RepID=A0AAN9KGB0_CLITE
MFSIEFHLPCSLSKSKKKARVQALINQLGLRIAINIVIGDEGHHGVSGAMAVTSQSESTLSTTLSCCSSMNQPLDSTPPTLTWKEMVVIRTMVLFRVMREVKESKREKRGKKGK